MNQIKKIIAAPSILSAQWTNLSRVLSDIEKSGAQWIHLDVMDGRFVPEITFGAKMVRDIRAETKQILDVHLMCETPERQIDSFAEAGADCITFHLEAGVHSHAIIQEIRRKNIKAGIAIVPSTPVFTLDCLLPFVDIVLVMTVNPGAGGQSLINECLEKASVLSDIRKTKNYNYLISLDGGINSTNACNAVDAGADVLVTGSAFFNAKEKCEFVKQICRQK